MGKVTTFTPEEIAELEKKPSEVAREKIAATGSKEALEAFDQIVGMFNGVHDGYLMQCNAAVSGLYKEVGPEKYRLLRERRLLIQDRFPLFQNHGQHRHVYRIPCQDVPEA